ncbi:histidine phosphatase family protein, partial [Bacillus cereus]|uniref:histidine phosphatase family protein n=1 Tax=Bacillus cereus TaxID=1396 RepID=UPI00283F5990
PMDAWMQKLEATFTTIDIALSGGESTKQATNRALSLIQDVLQLNTTTTLIVTHGNLLTLILTHCDHTIGLNEWRTLTNPDSYEITID